MFDLDAFYHDTGKFVVSMAVGLGLLWLFIKWNDYKEQRRKDQMEIERMMRQAEADKRKP